ncbi:MAG: sodium:calcium antiporter [Armatimonadota bacterium]|nr:sodium:calcium antiporter [Armatimonadota bacterium]
MPWILVFYAGPRDAHGHWELSHLTIAILSGIAILGAAFLLSWGAEVAQLDMAQSLALVILSLIAILPEYAVSMIFAWGAGKGFLASQNPATANLPETSRLLENVNYTTANMTGANRILIGIALSAVVFIYYWRTRERQITVESARGVEIKFLLLATLYSFTLPIKAVVLGERAGGLNIIDAVVLVALFGFYTRATAQTEHVEPELIGPPALIALLERTPRRLICLGLFAFAAWAIFLASHPFSDSLVEVGKTYRVNEFLLVQWIAPLASEMPEFIVAGLFAWRGLPTMGMGTLISSKVNQWTLLVGLLPVTYSLAAKQLSPLPLDGRQSTEVLLTSAQSLYAVAVLLNFNISVWEGVGLLVLFLAQAITQICINIMLPNTPATLWLTQSSQLFFSAIYIALALYIIFASAERKAILYGMFRSRKGVAAGIAAARATPEPKDRTDLTESL